MESNEKQQKDNTNNDPDDTIPNNRCKDSGNTDSKQQHG
jgi:hypothetical protein